MTTYSSIQKCYIRPFSVFITDPIEKGSREDQQVSPTLQKFRKFHQKSQLP